MSLLRNSFKVYLSSLHISFWFALLLIFTALFPLFTNMVYSSGTVFLEYTFNVGQLDLWIELIAISIYTVLYAFLLAATVFGVRKELTGVRAEKYISELLHGIAFRLAVFFLLFTLISILIAFILLLLKVNLVAIAAVLFVLTVPFMFMPQVIVIEELPIFEAMAESLDFSKRNWKFHLSVLVLGSLLLAVLLAVEYLIDVLLPNLFLGRIAALLLGLLFVVPFIESMKTYFYLLKSGLVKALENWHER